MDQLGNTATFIIGESTGVAVAWELTKLGVKGAFIVDGIGLWEGIEESAVMAKVDGLTNLAQAVAIAEGLRIAFKQQSVLLEWNATAYLV